MHLPPALSEIYGGPRPEWLRELFDQLPRLQSLIVSKLPFFDHSAMMALGPRSYDNVRLLIADGEPNTTSVGLATVLSRLPRLMYLDLSYTSPARDPTVLSTLAGLQDLQILKLRGINLKDSHVEFLANAIGYRVRVLDLRNNMLTDMAVRSLMEACFLPRDLFQRNARSRSSLVTDILRRPDLDEEFLRLLTRPMTGRSVLENLSHDGITHLYISDNRLTVEGVASLLASGNLHLLDAGTVNTAESLRNGQQSPWSPGERAEGNEVFPGAEKFVPILGTYAKANIVYLRVHHSVVTKDAPPKESLPELLPELPGDEQLDARRMPPELDPEAEIREAPGDIPVYELEDTSISPESARIEPSIQARRKQYQDEPLSPRRGSVFAPESLDTSNPPPDDQRRSSGTSQTPASQTSTTVSRARRIQELLSRRPENKVLPTKRGDAPFPYLHPSHIPHVETLILTDVPSHVPPNSPIISSLIRFIKACSDESQLATLRAKADYSLPPGRARIDAEKRHARSLFALRQLVLEITPTQRREGSSTSWKPQRRDPSEFRSSTGDSDLEKLWSAATDDFSFFGDEECGVPDLTVDEAENRRMGHAELEGSIPSPGSQQMSVSLNQLSSSRQDNGNQANDVDLVATIAAFRKEKKAEYTALVAAERAARYAERAAQSAAMAPSNVSPPSPHQASSQNESALPPHVDGHWKGEVKVVRNAVPKGRTGLVDFYGNYFEKGYLYP